MRISKVKARNVREGDRLVVTVSRVLGMQGRKPTGGRAPLMRIELDDGTTWTTREDEQLERVSDS